MSRMFERQDRRTFNLKPRYWDPEKEEREEREKRDVYKRQEYISEWRSLLSKTAYFHLEDWYAEMGIADTAQAAIYTERCV